MITLVIKDITLLKEWLDALRTVTDEATIFLESDGVLCIEHNKTNGTLIAAKITKDVFNEYSIKEKLHFRVNLDDVISALRNITPKDKTQLIIEKSILTILSEGRVTRKKCTPVYSHTAELQEIPKFDFKFISEIAPELLSTLDEFAGDEMEITFEDKLTFRTTTNQRLDETTINADKIEISKKPEGIVTAQYTLDIFQRLIKTATAVKKVELCFSKDHPLSLKFEKDGFKVIKILAPRIKSD